MLTCMNAVSRTPVALVALILLAGCQRLLMPTPNLYVHAEEDPFADVPEVFRSNKVDLLYATDREPEAAKDGSLAYGYGRSPSLAWGSCIVEIGRNVSWDDLVAASRTATRKAGLPIQLGPLVEVGRFPATPPPVKIVDGKMAETREYIDERKAAYTALQDELRRRLALTSRKEAYLFVHGFKNTLEDAAFRMAEIWHFVGREGVPILYSWPAGHPGLMRGYTADRESSEFTVYHLREFLTALAGCPELERVHVIAHSRGTDVLATALRELVLISTAAGLDPQATYKIGHFVLAAPDLDLDVSQQRHSADRIDLIFEQGTIYVTPNDRALGSAEWLFGSRNRMGKLRPEELGERTRQRLGSARDRDVVDSRVKTDYMAHAYFLGNPATSSDLVLVLRYDRPPGAEHGRPLTEIAPNWYIIDDSYPQQAAPLPRELQGK
jgi:esterase/lipase superfamily enzyme